MTEITKKERTMIAIFDEVLRYLAPSVSCRVQVGALGRRELRIYKTYQHTLHDYGVMGIDKVAGVHHFDITVNKKFLTPELSGGLTKTLLTSLENDVDKLRC